MNLTGDQLRAITRTGQDVCVVAGPGSGKTRVLVERFRWLVQDQNIDPARILAITFTEKAANEVRKRLAEYFAGDPIRRAEIERAPVSTIHGFCTRILKENAIAAGLDPEFEVLDEREADLILRQSIDDSLNALLKSEPDRLRKLYLSWAAGRPVDALARAYEAVRLAGDDWPPLNQPSDQSAFENLRSTVLKEKAKGDLLSILDWCMDPQTVPPQMPRGVRAPSTRQALEAAKAAWATAKFKEERATLDFLLRDIDRSYANAKRIRSRVDFNDLEAFTIQFLEQNAAIRRSVQNRFDAILMDEVQDTNPLQWRLMELVRRDGRFFAVGDMNQAIYGFRHARPDAFRHLRTRVQESGGAVDQLRENFRSRSEILTAAEEIVGTEAGMEKPGLVAGRTFTLSTTQPVERIVAEHDDTAERVRLEAKMISKRILELVGALEIETRSGTRLADFSDIALLFRTSLRYKEYEQALLDAGIPYLITGGRTFFEQQEVCDLISWLRVLANPRDEVALVTVLRSPFAGIADESLLQLRVPGEPLITSLRNSTDSRVQLLLRHLDESRLLSDDRSPDMLLGQAMDACNFEGRLDSAAAANVRKLLSIVRERFAAKPETLPALIDHLDRLRDVAEEQNAPVSASTNAVQIMTIHAAKGLEFPIVFLPSLDADARRDSGGGLVYSRETGLGAKWRLDNGDEFADSTALTYAELASEREKEESNRLLYVAMTRAEQKLVLSSAGDKRGWTKLVARVPLSMEATPTPSLVVVNNAVPATQIQLVDRPALNGQHDFVVSATDAALFAYCPRRYFLERYLGWRRSGTAWTDDEDENQPIDYGELTASELGSQVHALLAGVFLPKASDEARRLAHIFESSEIGHRAAQSKRQFREQEFTFAFGNLMVRGQIDLWFEDENQLTLVDYKTDALGPTPLSEFAYGVQLDLYAEALKRLTGRKPDQSVVHFLTANKLVPITTNGQGINTLEKLKASQEEQRFPLNEGGHCQHCPQYRGACPSAAGETQLALFN